MSIDDPQSPQEMSQMFAKELPKFFQQEERSSMTEEQKEIWEEFKSTVWLLLRSLTINQYFILYKMYRLSKKCDNLHVS